MGIINVVCSHQRGDTTVVLCCISEVEEGRAIAFQIQGVPIETDSRSYVFDSLEEARRTLEESDWPHA